MKKILILTILSLNFCFAEDTFLSVCKNPTPEQKKTIHALIDGYNEYRRLENREQLDFNDPDICNTLSKGKGFPDVRRKGISDISIIKYFSGNNTLDLWDNKITDITSLKYLTKLKELNLMSNDIEKGVESLANLPLKKLSISLINNTNINPIGKITTLEHIFIFGGKNYEVLNNLKKLNHARLTSIEVTDLCKLENFKSLERLYLTGNNLKSLKCIENFTNLRYLEIKENDIIDLSPLIPMDNLKELIIRNVPVEDLSPLAKMKNLRSVNYSETKVKYLSPLAKSKSLKFASDISYKSIYGLFDRTLAWCSPKNMKEVREGISCFEKDGTLKSFWKRWLGL